MEGPNADAGSCPQVALSEGTPVLATDGFVGTVGHVHRDPRQGEASGFVLHKGLVAVVDVFVPIDWVADADADAVHLLVSRNAVERLVDPHRTPTL